MNCRLDQIKERWVAKWVDMDGERTPLIWRDADVEFLMREVARLQFELSASDAWLRMWKTAAVDDNSVERRVVDKVRLMIEERDGTAKSK